MRVTRRLSKVKGRAFRKEARLVVVYELKNRSLWLGKYRVYLSMTCLLAQTSWILLMPA